MKAPQYTHEGFWGAFFFVWVPFLHSLIAVSPSTKTALFRIVSLLLTQLSAIDAHIPRLQTYQYPLILVHLDAVRALLSHPVPPLSTTAGTLSLANAGDKVFASFKDAKLFYSHTVYSTWGRFLAAPCLSYQTRDSFH